MLTCATVAKREIRGHYNLATPFYRLLWGPHIHHGLWEEDETPRRAQAQLTERLAMLAGIRAGQTLLDVGCGMGGSAIHLAKTRGCKVVGVTISPLQRFWSTAAAHWHRMAGKTMFCCADVEAIGFRPASFDVIWSVECTEHLFEKKEFIVKAAQWLRPGGTLAICAWLAGEALNEHQRRQVYDVCEGFFCPSLGTSREYVHWMTAAGLEVLTVDDWTAGVAKTWQICRERVASTRLRGLARWIDRGSVRFLDRFSTILSAYESGAMKYGCFIARKPG